MHRKIPTPITVAIVGGDPIVGQAIGALLENTDYGTRFIAYPVTDGSRNMLTDAHVVLLTSGLSAEFREEFLSSDLSRPATIDIPVLELTSEPNEAKPGQRRQVRWPCPLEQLRREIEAALAR
jgi:hypothetical protein